MNLKKVRKKTAYNAEKNNKMNNFEHLNRNYCKKGQTVLAGDSIMEIFNHTELFAEYISETGTAVYNRGISGDTSDRLLERFEKNVINISPCNIVLLIGTNDLGVGADIDFAVDNIRKIIVLSKERIKDVHIILEAVYPVNNGIVDWGKRNNRDIAKLNSKLKQLAAELGVEYLDLTKQLSDDKGRLKAEYTYDGLHPNVLGFEIAAREIIPLLKK